MNKPAANLKLATELSFMDTSIVDTNTKGADRATLPNGCRRIWPLACFLPKRMPSPIRIGGPTMSWDEVAGKWKQVKGSIKQGSGGI